MFLVYAIILIIVLAVSYFVTAGLTWLVCWAFSITFTWKLAVGVWAAIALLGGIFKSTSSK